MVNDQEGYNLKAIAGEIDIAQFGLEAANVSLYKENEEKGDYQLLMWKAPDGSEAAYGFNMTHTDPVLREIFQDIRFGRRCRSRSTAKRSTRCCTSISETCGKRR